jgi:integrase
MNEGHICAIPYGTDDQLCPVKALSQWCEQAGITNGYIFTQMNKKEQITKKPINAHHIGIIIKSIAISCKLPDAQYFSGHSLRRGFATTASQKGASLMAIMRHGRWRHQATVIGYIEEGQRFEENAAMLILNSKTSKNTS